MVIVDYKAGNLASVRLAFEALGISARITDRPEVVKEAERVVFPGVGAAGAAMRRLRELGLDEALREVAEEGRPFIGICLGTQIIFDRTEEDGGVAGLGLVRGEVRRFRPRDRTEKVPQIGWNQVNVRRAHPVLAGIENGSEFYFVHSYYPCPASEDDVAGTTDYAGATFASVVARRNIVATQFHPEKSGRIGLRLLENFSRWDGAC